MSATRYSEWLPLAEGTVDRRGRVQVHVTARVTDPRSAVDDPRRAHLGIQLNSSVEAHFDKTDLPVGVVDIATPAGEALKARVRLAQTVIEITEIERSHSRAILPRVLCAFKHIVGRSS